MSRVSALRDAQARDRALSHVSRQLNIFKNFKKIKKKGKLSLITAVSCPHANGYNAMRQCLRKYNPPYVFLVSIFFFKNALAKKKNKKLKNLSSHQQDRWT